jgi:putative oxidoreductase
MPNGTAGDNRRTRTGVTILRVAAASVFVIHGSARIALGGVEPFGAFLVDSGLPFGTLVAWLITIVEVSGGLLLAMGIAVRPLVLWFGIQIAVGILLVHGKDGWFVVGAGRNGAEYSVLILVVLLAIWLTDSVAYKPVARLRSRPSRRPAAFDPSA